MSLQGSHNFTITLQSNAAPQDGPAECLGGQEGCIAAARGGGPGVSGQGMARAGTILRCAAVATGRRASRAA